MKALVVEALHQAPVYKDMPNPELKDNQVIVKVRAAALNHRDVYITQGLYPGIVFPAILGSDVTGEVVELGAGVSEAWLGKAVVINPNNNWGSNPEVQSAEYHILGMPSQGGFAEYICVEANRLAIKPLYLNFEEAAAFPLAGLTAYRALFSRAGAKIRERVLISGIGGGVALMACQMAIAAGCEVWVTSGSDDKIAKAVDLGAKGGVNYKNDKWHKELLALAGDGFDVIVDSAGGEGFKYFLDLANPAARIVFYGGTKGNFTVNPQKMFWKQLSVLGATMGNDKEFEDMITFVNKHKIVPIVDETYPLERGAEAFAKLDAGTQFGKLVLVV